jgi:hypothetical protein
MKVSKILAFLLILAILFAHGGAQKANAGAYESSWVTSITYQNIGNVASTNGIKLQFYANPDTTVPIEHTLGDLNAGASSSVYVGSILTGAFQGTAVMSADVPLAAVLVQVVPTSGSPVKVRPLSNGFSSGTSKTIVPTAFKQSNIYTLFTVQNAGLNATTVNLKFIDTNAVKVFEENKDLAAGAGYAIDMGLYAGVGSTFNGSVIMEAANQSDQIVSSAMELNTGADNTARAFEGVPQGLSQLFMPNAACKASGQTSYYAIQNTDLSNTAHVTVEYTWKRSNGTTFTNTKALTISKGAKQSTSGCDYDSGSDPTNLPGSALVTSSDYPIAVIGKTGGPGWTTAYGGFGTGTAKVALPYVRWADDANYNTGKYQRTYIAIQNISGFTLPANSVTVTYIDPNGNQQGNIHYLAEMLQGGKLNSLPTNAGLTTFGYWNNYTTSGGGAKIECSVANCKLAVLARITTFTGPGYQAAEDYSGIPWQ